MPALVGAWRHLGGGYARSVSAWTNDVVDVAALTRPDLLAGRSPDPAPITNSACYSPITADTASWLTAVFAYDPVSATMQPVPGAAGEAAGRSTDNYKEMNRWFNTLMEDSFA